MKYFTLILMVMVPFITTFDRVEKETTGTCHKYTITDKNGYKASIWRNLKTEEMWLENHFYYRIEGKRFSEYVDGTFGCYENFYYYLRNKYYEQLTSGNQKTVLNTWLLKDKLY